MRKAGTLPDEADAARFVAYLTVEGIRSQADAGDDGYDVWVWDDDHLARAGEALEHFRANPADPRYAPEPRDPEAPVSPRRRFSLRAMAASPLTTALGAAACIVTVFWMSGGRVEPLVTDHHTFRGEPWRLLTSALPHAGVFHLLFNVYWLWIFGARIEGVYGTARYAGLIALLAAGSSCAEYAVSAIGGVGLSGVGYGLFGFLWLASRRIPRFAGAIENSIVWLFVGWFFLCIVLTHAGEWRIANVAHGAGAALGLMVAWTIASRRRWIPAAALGGTLALTLIAATWARPIVFPGLATMERIELAADYLRADDYAAAREQYEAYLREGGSAPPGRAIAHYNLACIFSLQSGGEAGELRDRAFEHLRLAFDEGFDDVTHAREDADLASLHDDARWEATIGGR